MLELHIFYLRQIDVAKFKTLLDSLTRVVGMNVYLYYLIVLDNYNAVTYGFKISSQL